MRTQTDRSMSEMTNGISWFTKAIMLLPLLVNSCALPPELDIQTTPHFQVIKWPVLRAYLQAVGFKGDPEYNGYPEYFWQSANGNTLYVQDGDDVLLIGADGPTPRRVTRPKNIPWDSYWVDPMGQIKYLPQFAFPEDDRHPVIDNQSGLFVQITSDGIIHVGKMDSATGWLFTVHGTDQFDVDQVCACGEVVYLLDHSANNTEPSYVFSEKNCWAFAPDPKNPTKYIKIGEFSVPGIVKITDPFSPRFFCYGYVFAPAGGGYPLLYDALQHKVVTRLPENEVVLFLNGDWLTEQLEKNRTTKDQVNH